MVVEWTAFELIRDNAVTELFGSLQIFALFLVVIFLILMIGSGIPFMYSLFFSLPVFAGFLAAGWFTTSWIIHIIVLIAAIFYGLMMVRLFSQ